MELLFFAVIVLQLALLVYMDFQNRSERERLQMKLMSKDLAEYKSLTEETPEDSESEEPDPYLTIEEAGIEKIVKAKEKQ